MMVESSKMLMEKPLWSRGVFACDGTFSGNKLNKTLKINLDFTQGVYL